MQNCKCLKNESNGGNVMDKEIKTYQIDFEKTVHIIHPTSCIASLPKARKKEKRGYHHVPIYLGYRDRWIATYN